jgi:hypothetical protein
MRHAEPSTNPRVNGEMKNQMHATPICSDIEFCWSGCAHDLIKPRVSLFFCPQMNVSREEYERMYQVYLQSVEMQRLQEEAEDEPARAQPQTFHSIQNEPSAGESQKNCPTLFKIRRRMRVKNILFPTSSSASRYFYCIFHFTNAKTDLSLNFT